jgi:hypothetical protein
MSYPNVLEKFLPLSGGTMSGTIKRNGFLAQNIVDDNLLIIRGGTDATSAFLGLCGKNHSNKGMAYFCATDGTNTTNFCVLPEGYATLAGSRVITSAGGSITGNLAISNMYCNKLDTSVTWGVGTTWNDAPSISLYGPNETSSGIPNCFSIRAGANKYALTGKPDGNLYWGGSKVLTEADKTNVVQWLMPNYSAQVTVTMPYTAPSKGWFIAHSANVSTTITVNGISVSQGDWWSGAWSGNLNCQILVDKGDVIRGATGTMRFIPCKGGV